MKETQIKTDPFSSEVKSEQSTLTDQEVFQRMQPLFVRCLTLNHDLNNPLAGVIGYAEFMLDDESTPVTEDHRRFIEKIMSCAERMREMIEELSVLKVSLSEDFDITEYIDRHKPDDPAS
ncbi:MAG: histidine kinase dimerization/phospho-acceptor domain-containing protein [candidate division Zixibacteria bacterium]